MAVDTDAEPAPPDAEGAWVSLFSGGKDSSFALYRGLERGLDVERLLTVHPDGDSYMYHVPATRLAALAAESVGIDHVDVHPENLGGDAGHDSGSRGDAEVEPLERALRDLDEAVDVAGVTAGAVESEYQTSRIRALCDRLGIALYAPVWRRDPWTVAEEMIDAGFDTRVVQVAAAGLDASWLGRPLDRAALADLRDLNERYGVHPLGEGGEFETLVVDGPHMDRRVDIEWEREWEGTRGRLRITDARLD
ncbi:ATP-binding protein [Halobacteriales archaeon SW_5_70_135]|nr:MAG: ATP-binding protein [Halobacteriales archaeon SW_5_70_135]